MRKRYGGTVLALAAVLTGSSVSTLAAEQLALPMLLKADFEAGAESILSWNVSGNAPTVTSSPTRAGKFAIKTTLDRLRSEKSYRTELSSNGRVKIVPGQDYWYGFSIFLPSDYVADPIWEIPAQWHSVPDAGTAEVTGALNPPIALHSEDGVWQLVTRWDSRRVTVKPNYEGGKTYALGPYAKGKWTDWVFHIRWSPTSQGLLQVWQNGEKKLDIAGPIGFNDSIGPYLKVGLYKGWKDRLEPVGVVGTRTLYHDEVRIAGPGSRYEDVVPGGAGGPRRPLAPLSVRIEH